ncbi:MAG: hypothetical protein AAGA60_06445 [Cyanobacteria bacterium P01_E01_bin.42]
MFIEDTDTICPVHNIELITDRVPAFYGLISYFWDRPPEIEQYYMAQKKYFPQSKFSVRGGCVITPSSPFFHKVNYYPLCREEHKKWCTENNTKIGLIPDDFDLELHIQEEIERCWKSRGQVPEEVLNEVFSLIEQEKITAAIKLLKRANMKIPLYAIKSYIQILKVNYIQR